MQAIYFDMDGTVYDLYGVENWEPKLRAENTSPYYEGGACGNLEELNSLLESFVAIGITIGVITWTSMQGSKEYNKAVRKVKYQWIQENMPSVTEFHCVRYGTPKHTTANIKDSILVDDNAKVRQAWTNGKAIDASSFEEMLKSLQNILDTIATI